MSGTARLQAATSRLDALESDYHTSQLLAAFAPPEQSYAIVQHLHSLDSGHLGAAALSGQTSPRVPLCNRMTPSHPRSPLPTLLFLHLPPFRPPAPNPTAHGPLKTPTLIHLALNTMYVLAGPCPSHDDSPILVDSVTLLSSSLPSVHSRLSPPGHLASTPSPSFSSSLLLPPVYLSLPTLPLLFFSLSSLSQVSSLLFLRPFLLTGSHFSHLIC